MNDRPPAVRASDADRERVARTLGEHGAAGRLTPEELEQRLDAAYAARTQGDLERLLDDLPPTPAPRAEDPARAVAAAAGGSGWFWPILLMLVAVLGLSSVFWRTLGPGGGLSDEELGERRRRTRTRR